MKSGCPAKKIPSFFLVLALFFCLKPGLCAERDLFTEIQKQAGFYRQQGLKLQQEGNMDAAISCYQKAIALDPNYAAAYNDLGILFEAKGWPKQAKEMYLKAIKLAPEYPNSYSNLALLYEEEKDYVNAILYWLKRAMLGGPNDPWAEVARKRLEDIAKIYPEAYREIGAQYKDSLEKLNASKPYFSEDEFGLGHEFSAENLFSNEATSGIQRPANYELAVSYLERSKRSFYRGEYVNALKEASIAEYLDSSNKEISVFINKVRKALLE